MVIQTPLLVAAADEPLQCGAPKGPLGYIIPPGCLGSQAGNYNADTKEYLRDPDCDCGVREIVQLGINVTQIIFALLGSVTLGMFIYGGFVWLTSAGNAKQIEKGKDIFKNTFMGLVIIFGAWTIINLVLLVATGTTPGTPIKLFPTLNESTAPFELPK